jgi:hypothetical protein
MIKNKTVGSETEVVYDFVFEPPRAQIEVQSSAFAGLWTSFVYRAVHF